MSSNFWTRMLMVVVLTGCVQPCAADLETPGGSVDRIERDIREIHRLQEINRRRQQSFHEQVQATESVLARAGEARETARAQAVTAREGLIRAQARVAAAMQELEALEKSLTNALRQESPWMQVQAQHLLARKEWEQQQARVLEALAEQAEYRALQAMLTDARQRADSQHGITDPALRKAALETVHVLESRIARMHDQAIQADPSALAALNRCNEIQAQLDQLEREIQEKVQASPLWLQAKRILEKTKSEGAQAQRLADQTKLREIQAQAAVTRAQTQLQELQAGLLQTEKEQERLENLLISKQYDLRRALGNRKPKS